MAFPRAPGWRNIGSDLMRFIPKIYSGKMLVEYYDTTVLSHISNTDYEGEIKKFGDTVYIRSRPAITIRDYKKGQALVNEQPESTAVELTIDKGKYWSFVTEDLDQVQSDIKNFVQICTEEGAEALKTTIDSLVLGDIYADPHASNQGATAGVRSKDVNLGALNAPVELTKSNILDVIVQCGQVLDEQNVPDAGRYMILPPSFCTLIKTGDLKDASLTGDAKSPIRTSVLGTIDRFTIYPSNLLTKNATDDATECLFGHKDAFTFATQLIMAKMQDNPDGFGMLHRGLNVFGYKVVKPEALGCLHATKGA